MRDPMNRSGRAGWLVIGAALLVALPALGATARKPPQGKALYRQYCASCHGEDGKGSGPVAASLTTKPTDLTQLAKGANGKFPFAAVMDAIDGTKDIRAHGGATMPVWGTRFEREAGTGIAGHTGARGKLMLLTEYLQSIQQK